jgi:hypothetical protein
MGGGSSFPILLCCSLSNSSSSSSTMRQQAQRALFINDVLQGAPNGFKIPLRHMLPMSLSSKTKADVAFVF